MFGKGNDHSSPRNEGKVYYTKGEESLSKQRLGNVLEGKKKKVPVMARG